MLRALWRSWLGPRVMSGQKWEFVNFTEKGNPFMTSTPFYVKVLAVKRRWVLYERKYGITSSMKVDLFRFCYKLSAE